MSEWYFIIIRIKIIIYLVQKTQQKNTRCLAVESLLLVSPN